MAHRAFVPPSRSPKSAAPTPASADEVPAACVPAVGDTQLADWKAIGDDPQHAQLTVLTACRIWRLAEERHHCYKTAAGSGRSGVTPLSWSVVMPLPGEREPQLLAYLRARIARR
jgi:hypothetical protein